MSQPQAERPFVWTVDLPDAAATQAWGEALGEVAQAAVCVALHGDLGAGKTTFAQGVGRGLAVDSEVVSPTFSLVDEHDGTVPLLHADAYRLQPGEAEGIGLEETLENWPGVSLVEWASRVEDLLPLDGIDVELAVLDDGRRGEARARGTVGRRVLLAWKEQWEGHANGR